MLISQDDWVEMEVFALCFYFWVLNMEEGMQMDVGKFIVCNDGAKIFLRIWDEVQAPIGIVQIFHGMAEHSGRYDDFAKFLNLKGFIVYADDHRGHGLSVGEKNVLAYVGEDGFNNIVEDERNILEIIRKSYKDLPLYIFAHSFGSFIGQEFIIRYSNVIQGIILSGSAKQDGIEIKFAKLLANLQNFLFDNSKPAKLLDKLSFGSYNDKVENKTSKFDWLSRDKNEVNKYIEDDLSGYVSPIDFYYNLFHGFKDLYKRDRLSKINKELPILIISGDMDPVGKYGDSVKRLYDTYKDLNIEDLSLKLFQNGRHELLNEINRLDVYDYIYKWIKAR